MTDTLPLSELLARHLALDWFEAVALVRAITERLIEQQGTRCHVPELHQITLAADGTVTVGEGVGGTEPVRRLGQLLQALLADAEVPVQLRLVVSQATAPIPSYTSAEDVDRALAYFERPDRADILRSLFARANAAVLDLRSNPELTLDRIAPLPDVSLASTSAPMRRKRLRRLTAVAAIVLAVLGLCATAASFVRRGGLPVEGHQVSRATVAAADAVGAVVIAGMSAVSDRVGLGRIVAADAGDTTPAAAEPGRGNRRGNRAARGAALSPAEAASRAWVVVAYDLPGGVVANEPPVILADAPDSVAASLPDSAIYTPAAFDVLPPIGLRSQLPRQLPPTIDPADLTRIELTISRDGSVESAKLLGDRRDVLGGMFLSAAKAWQFHPAMKDGGAVRYRKTILVSFE